MQVSDDRLRLVALGLDRALEGGDGVVDTGPGCCAMTPRRKWLM